MRKITALLLTFVLVFAAFPPVAHAAGYVSIDSGGTYSLADYGNDTSIYITTPDPVTITGGVSATYTNVQILQGFLGDMHLTISNVRIDNTAFSNASPLCIMSGTLHLTGENILTGGENKAGLEVAGASSLTISGSGSLTATGGYHAAGIGGSDQMVCGNLTITGCTVTAYGGYHAAGIGGGSHSSGSNGTVTIDHATVTAVGGTGGAGIGGGGATQIGFGNVNINSSTVFAIGDYAAGIGAGVTSTGGGTVSITSSDSSRRSLVFADGSVQRTANDIGNGAYAASGMSWSISGDSMVFLRHDSCVTPTVNGGQTHHSALTATNGKYLGISLPAGWDSGFGAYLHVDTTVLTLDNNGGPGETVTEEVQKNQPITLPGRGAYSDPPNILINWNTQPNGNGTAYEPGGTVTLTGPLTLYAYRAVTHVTQVQMSSASLQFFLGDAPKQLTATVVPDYTSYPDVTWASSNASVATVDSTGLVTALKAGTATITATADGVTGTCTVTVTVPVTGVTLDRSSIILAAGVKERLAATVSPSGATDKAVTWETSNQAVATVDEYGVVTAKAVGRAVVTVKTHDGNFTAACEVFVSNVLLNIRMPVGSRTALAVTQTSGSATAAWRSSNVAVATVDSSGVVTAMKEGSAVVTLTSGGMSQSVGILVGAPVSIAAPANVRTASSGYNSVNIAWNAVGNATKYQLWRATSSTGIYTLISTTTACSATATGLATGTTYYFKVRAIYEGSAIVYGAYSAVVSGKPVPAAPASPKAVRASASSIRVSWAAVAGATKYEVWRATASSGTYSLVTTTASQYFTNTGLRTGRVYYYKVRAYRLVGSTKIYGAYSAVVSAKP